MRGLQLRWGSFDLVVSSPGSPLHRLDCPATEPRGSYQVPAQTIQCRAHRGSLLPTSSKGDIPKYFVRMTSSCTPLRGQGDAIQTLLEDVPWPNELLAWHLVIYCNWRDPFLPTIQSSNPPLASVPHVISLLYSKVLSRPACQRFAPPSLAEAIVKSKEYKVRISLQSGRRKH